MVALLAQEVATVAMKLSVHNFQLHRVFEQIVRSCMRRNRSNRTPIMHDSISISFVFFKSRMLHCIKHATSMKIAIDSLAGAEKKNESICITADQVAYENNFDACIECLSSSGRNLFPGGTTHFEHTLIKLLAKTKKDIEACDGCFITL